LKKQQNLLSVAGQKQQHEKWQNEKNAEAIWDFLGQGWVLPALDLLKEGKGVSWDMNMQGVSWGRSSQKECHFLIHKWASGKESESDRLFLDAWMEHNGDLDGLKMFKERGEESKRGYGLCAPTSPLRIAIRCRNWGKAQMLYDLGCEWGSSHADIFCEALLVGTNYRRDGAIDEALALLELPNVKDWINQSITDNSYGQTTALCKAIISGASDPKMQALADKLLEKGADINAVMGNGDTILHRVMGRNGETAYKQLAKKVIKLGGDLTAINNEGDTPLSSWRKRFQYDRKTTPEEISTMEKEWLQIMANQVAPTTKGAKKTRLAL
jgi:hypothetical protein